jgi:hypothetical protein
MSDHVLIRRHCRFFQSSLSLLNIQYSDALHLTVRMASQIVTASQVVTIRPRLENKPVDGVHIISDGDPRHQVRLRHPGCSGNNNVLLSLFAPDHPSGGMHHETACIACAIVAWGGYFTETVDGEQKRVTSGPESILPGKNYFSCPSVSPL